MFLEYNSIRTTDSLPEYGVYEEIIKNLKSPLQRNNLNVWCRGESLAIVSDGSQIK